MTEGQKLLLVLVLLYLFDCVLWVGARTVLFAAPWCRKWRGRFAGPHLGNRDGSVALGNPLPPLGAVFAAHWFPISLSPIGVCGLNLQALGGAHRCCQSGRVFGYEDIDQVEAEGKHLLINGERFAKCESFDQAGRLAKLVEELKAASAGKREALLRHSLAARFDTERARERLKMANHQVGGIRLCCLVFFAYLYVILPVLVCKHGLTSHMISAAAIILFSTALICLQFFLGHRKLHPQAGFERTGDVVKMMLCPPAAIRAHDQLSMNAMSEFHPILLAHLLQAEGRDALAGGMVRDLSHPLPHGLDDPQAKGIVSWHAQAELAACAAFLQSVGTTTMAGLRGAPAWDGHASKYCPRCLGQFKTDAPECPDCPGVALLPVDSTPNSETNHA